MQSWQCSRFQTTGGGPCKRLTSPAAVGFTRRLSRQRLQRPQQVLHNPGSSWGACRAAHVKSRLGAWEELVRSCKHARA